MTPNARSASTNAESLGAQRRQRSSAIFQARPVGQKKIEVRAPTPAAGVQKGGRHQNYGVDSRCACQAKRESSRQGRQWERQKVVSLRSTRGFGGGDSTTIQRRTSPRCRLGALLTPNVVRCRQEPRTVRSPQGEKKEVHLPEKARGRSSTFGREKKRCQAGRRRFP